MKTGLVMEGGAMRGMFTAGVTDVLLENEIFVDGAIGVSAGAAFGCNYASRQPGRAIRYNKKYARDWRFASWRSFILTGDLYGAEFDYHVIPYELDPFDYREFMKHDFYCVCTNARTGQAIYHKCGPDDRKEMDYIRGSASMPVVSHAVRVDGLELLDGGISDSIPLEQFEKRGYLRNIVILTQPRTYRKEPMQYKNMMKLLLHRYPRIYAKLKERPDNYNQEVAYVWRQAEKGKCFVIQPPADLNISVLTHDPEEKERVYQIGRQTTQKQLDDLKAFLTSYSK